MVIPAENESVKFMDWIKGMSFIQFHLFCGMLWDGNKFSKWVFWPGVRGYPGQADVAQAFADFVISWVLKARQLGISEIAALYAIYVCIVEMKAEVIIISKKISDAKYFLKKRVLSKLKAAYNLQMSPGVAFPWPEYQDNSDTGKIIFPHSESWIEAVSSDNEEVRSRTPRLVIFDEIRSYSHSDAEELWSAILPALNNNPDSQAIGISSAKYGTWYNSMTTKIINGDISGIKLLFLPDDTHPMRTKEWRSEERKKWSNQTLFLREHPLNPDDCFISREGAVFPMFDNKPGGRHVNHVPINWSHKYIIGYDHGRQHPAVLLLMLFDRFENHLYVFDEVFCREMELPEIALSIRAKMAHYVKNHGAPKPVLRIADRACFNRDGRKTVAEILRELTGITFKESIKPGIADSIDDLGTRFSNNLITIDPRCVNTRQQISELLWKNDPKESKKEVPVDIEDDAVDVLRYACAELRGSVKKKPETISLKKKLEARDRLRRPGGPTVSDVNPHAWQGQ